MRKPRKFYLSTASGERFGLNGERGVWFTDPSGLGISLSPGFANARNGFFAVTLTDDVPQGAIYGTLVFTGASPYEDYQTFVSWAMAAGDGLLLVYAPSQTTEYYRRVMLTSLGKGEIRAPGWLHCEATLQTMTPWYSLSQLGFNLTPDDAAEQTMIYPWVYAPDLIYATDASGTQRAEFRASGHLPSALTLTYSGPAVNPSVRLVGARTGAAYGRLALNAVIGEKDRLEYSSRYLDNYVRCVREDGSVEDLMASVDLAFEPWLRAPLDEPVTLLMTAGSSLPGDARLRVYDYFWSV